jgi:hypothetical protein
MKARRKKERKSIGIFFNYTLRVTNIFFEIIN